MQANDGLHTNEREKGGLEQRASDAITAFCGDMKFVYIHTVIFAAWIATRGLGQDHFPFNFLTMAVSLEAIFLSTFILISQNRQQAVAEEHSRSVQETLLRMLSDVIDDEKLDQANEQMIHSLLERVDVEHIQPLQRRIDEVAASTTRIEAILRGGAGASP